MTGGVTIGAFAGNGGFILFVGNFDHSIGACRIHASALALGPLTQGYAVAYTAREHGFEHGTFDVCQCAVGLFANVKDVTLEHGFHISSAVIVLR